MALWSDGPDGDDINDSRFNFLLAEEDEDLDTPIQRVFLLFKILFINLVIGCVCTVICLTVKRSVGRCLSFLLCGLCDNWECDYDGSHDSRSRQVMMERKVRKAGLPRCSPGYEDTMAWTIWLICKSFWSNKKLVKKVVILIIGMIAGYMILIMSSRNHQVGGGEPLTPIHSFSNRAVFGEDTDNPKRVFVVTPTSLSGIQNARLVRLAQALVSSRDFVTWIIVSTDPVPRYLWYSKRKTEHWDRRQGSIWKRDEGRILAHLDDLYEVVSRFGIPFVILSGHEIHHRNLGFVGGQLNTRTSLSTFMKASLVGLTWVTKTFHSGTLLVFPDDAVVNFNLIREVQGTKLMSSWPTAFDPRYRFSLSTALLHKRKNTTEGYFVGGLVKMSEIPLQYASYALNIKLAAELQSAKVLWKLTFDNVYSSKDLSLKPYHVQALARNCTEIYVWKTGTTFSHVSLINRQKIPLKMKWLHTNVRQLIKIINKWFALDIYESIS